jgi:hypothetical protein
MTQSVSVWGRRKDRVPVVRVEEDVVKVKVTERVSLMGQRERRRDDGGKTGRRSQKR